MVSGCPNAVEQLLWLFGELSEAEQPRVESHIRTCARCASDMASLRRTVMALQAHAAAAGEASQDCLDEAQIAAWVDGEATESVLSHVATCARCRQASASLVRALEAQQIAAALPEATRTPQHGVAVSRRERKVNRLLARKVGVAALLAAAGIAGILLLRSSDLQLQRGEGTPAGLPAPPEAQAPVGSVLSVSQFRWGAVKGADLYRVTVFDEQGTVVWEIETRDTHADRPAGSRFESGVRYLWQVAARVGWDRWVSSDLVSFSIAEAVPGKRP